MHEGYYLLYKTYKHGWELDGSHTDAAGAVQAKAIMDGLKFLSPITEAYCVYLTELPDIDVEVNESAIKDLNRVAASNAIANAKNS